MALLMALLSVAYLTGRRLGEPEILWTIARFCETASKNTSKQSLVRDQTLMVLLMGLLSLAYPMGRRLGEPEILRTIARFFKSASKNPSKQSLAWE